MLSLLILVLLPPVLNRFFDRDFYYDAMIHNHGSAMDRFFLKAVNSLRDVAITLNNGKVYIGVVTDMYSPIQEGEFFVKMLPSFSGYRDEKTKRLIITTDYLQAFSKIEDDDSLEEFETVIPTSEIMTTTFFNIETYRYFD